MKIIENYNYDIIIMNFILVVSVFKYYLNLLITNKIMVV